MSSSDQDDIQAISWQITPQGEFTRVEFKGDIDENADFSALLDQLRGPVEFHLSGVRRINSCGVREWVNFMRDLSGVTELRFVCCSLTIVAQMNMIYNFHGRASVQSFYAPFFCEQCNYEDLKLLDVDSHFPTRDYETVPDFHCADCDSLMALDDLPERYLAFLSMF